MMAKRISSTKHIFLFLSLLLQISSHCNALPLSTNSRWIVDSQTGKRVKLACANWVSHLQPMVAEGLEKKPLEYIAGQIANAGFNCVRFTWATYMFTRPYDYGNLTVSQSLDKLGLNDAKAGFASNNPQFLDTSVVELHKAVVDELGRNNLMVVLDNHVSEPKWCCDWNDGNGFFGDDSFDPKEWLQGLSAVASTYKGNPAVIGMSLRNELRGNRQNTSVWSTYMQQGAFTVHTTNPDFLVILSGLSYDTDLGFIKSIITGNNLDNKLVYEAHWYSFGIPSDKWAAQSNQLCGSVTQNAQNNYLYLTNNGDKSFPLFLSEFGSDQRGGNEADNRYMTCLLAAVAEIDVDWALWTFQGSYMLREGTLNLEEVYGVMDLNWDGPRNPPFLDRLQIMRQINQDPTFTIPTNYILYHPLSGRCLQINQSQVLLGNCQTAARWEQHQDNGPIKLADEPGCLAVGGDGITVLSSDCSSNWKFVSNSGLQLGAQDAQGNYLCLERSATDFKLLNNKCLCVGDDLVDFPTCNDNPGVQWFKFVPTNV